MNKRHMTKEEVMKELDIIKKNETAFYDVLTLYMCFAKMEDNYEFSNDRCMENISLTLLDKVLNDYDDPDVVIFTFFDGSVIEYERFLYDYYDKFNKDFISNEGVRYYEKYPELGDYYRTNEKKCNSAFYSASALKRDEDKNVEKFSLFDRTSNNDYKLELLISNIPLEQRINMLFSWLKDRYFSPQVFYEKWVKFKRVVN